MGFYVLFFYVCLCCSVCCVVDIVLVWIECVQYVVVGCVGDCCEIVGLVCGEVVCELCECECFDLLWWYVECGCCIDGGWYVGFMQCVLECVEQYWIVCVVVVYEYGFVVGCVLCDFVCY